METAATDASELTWFCTELPKLREQAAVEGWTAELDQAVAELREGKRPVAVVRAFRRRLGLTARPRGFTYVTLPGQDPAPPPRGSYSCPGRRCTRVASRVPGGSLPECPTFDEPLSFG